MQEFILTQDHITLLRHANVSWNGMEFGAPGIDPKRPYGNGDVVSDVARLLNIEPIPTDDGETHWPLGTTGRVNAIHQELLMALQVVLTSGEFVPGRYVAYDCDRNWQLQSIL